MAAIGIRVPPLEAGDGLCVQHLRDLLAGVPDSSRAGIVAARLEATAAAVARGREVPACLVCSRQEHATGRHSSDVLCLRHLRRFGRRLPWDAVRRSAAAVTAVLERGHGRGVLAALWGSDGLAGVDPGDGACSICAARADARVRQFEWLADAIHRFPIQATGAAVAVCAPHAWWFAAFTPGAGRLLAHAAAAEWIVRLRWLRAGLEDRPPDRLAARLRGLPPTLAGLADDEGRLHLAIILRAAAAAALHSPAQVLARLTAVAFGTEACPVCAAEDDAARKITARGAAVVCAADLRVARWANPDRGAWRAKKRDAIRRLRLEAAAVRDGGGAARDASSPVR